MTGPRREGYTGPDYGTPLAGWHELLEQWGYREPDEPRVGFEQDQRDDLDAERLGDDRPYGTTPSVRGNAINLRRAA